MRSTRWGVIVAAALIAAGLGDPLVETISGAGVFGAGYADRNHLGAVPVLIAALTLLAGIVWMRCSVPLRAALRGRNPHSFGAAAMRRPGVAQWALIFSLQLGGVLWMECAEAAVSGERLQPGLSWLGAPVPIALAIYAAVALCSMGLVHLCLRAMLGACARLVQVALEIVLSCASRHACKPLSELRDFSRRERHQTLLARRIGGRAPPRSPVASAA